MTPAGGALWLSLRRSVHRGVDVVCFSCAAQGILKLAGMDQNCAHAAIQECTAKMQFAVSAGCTVQLQPDLPVAADGTFCSPSRGVQQRGERLGPPAQEQQQLCCAGIRRSRFGKGPRVGVPSAVTAGAQ